MLEGKLEFGHFKKAGAQVKPAFVVKRLFVAVNQLPELIGCPLVMPELVKMAARHKRVRKVLDSGAGSL